MIKKTLHLFIDGESFSISVKQTGLAEYDRYIYRCRIDCDRDGVGADGSVMAIGNNELEGNRAIKVGIWGIGKATIAVEIQRAFG